MREVDRRTAALHLRGRPPRVMKGFSHVPRALTIRHRAERVLRCRVIGEVPAAERDIRRDTLRRATLDGGAISGPFEITNRARRRIRHVEGAPRVEDRAPPGATAQVGEEYTLDAVDVVGSRAAGTQGIEPHDDARRAEAALAR